MLYARVWDPSKRAGKGNWIRRSLKHRDRERAKDYALDQASRLRKGSDDLRQGNVTLAHVFAHYTKHRTPRKTEGEQRQDARRVELWTRVLGPDSDPQTVTLAAWEGFIDRSTTGAIDARGHRVKKARPIRPRGVEVDCDWLRWVFSWASKWRTEEGRYLMRENPVRGFDVPREQNPRRPVATQDRYEAIRAVSDDVGMEARWNCRREPQRSYLSELLAIVNGTGRRISAVCQLRYEDLRLDSGPYGAIRWPTDTDETGRETLVPIGPEVRTAVDRLVTEHPGIGSAPLFPKPEDPTRPITRHLADKWLRKAEQLASLESQRGSLWHAYRRKWATERKHLPDVDVAAAGGWSETTSLKRAYQQVDHATMLQVIL